MLLEKEKYKEKLIKTFFAFDKLCRENNIKYFAAYGTMLGAIRHKGLIPWDDDIDVFMLKADYDNFIKMKGSLAGYDIYDYHDEGYYLPYAKFADNSSTIWEAPFYEFVFGVYVDVFPLYYTSNDVRKNELRSELYRSLFDKYRQGFMNCSIRQLVGGLIRLRWGDVTSWMLTFYYKANRKRLLKKFDSLVSEFSKISGDYLIQYYVIYSVKKELCKAEWFRSQIEVPFEYFGTFLPVGNKCFLKQVYGDYMTPPPLDKRNTEHSLFYVNLERKLSLKEVKKIIKEK